MSKELFRVSAATVSSLKAGGELRRACFPKDERDLTEIYERFGDDVLFFGGLTNTLVPDQGLDEVALFSDEIKGVFFEGEKVVACAGERLSKVARLAEKRGLSGLEPLSHIPGTVGGAVFGNAGAYGWEISDVITGVDVFRFDTGKTEYLDREEIAFSYRYSNLSGREFVVRSYFSLRRDDATAIKRRTEEYKKRRSSTQPKEPSLGSVFCRHDDTSMGWYLERCGLKGVGRGAFRFSPRHAGFIVNTFPQTDACGTARAADYLSLVRLAEKRVYEEFGFIPKREVKIFDQGWQGD